MTMHEPKAPTEQSTTTLLLSSVLDSLDANVALLDADGTIVHINKAWRQFGQQQKPGISNDGIGTNYFETMRAETGPGALYARHILASLRDLTEGLRESFVCEFHCLSAGQRQWYSMRASRLDTHSPRTMVSLFDITESKLARVDLEQRFRRMSPREYEILDRIASGKSSKQIAAELRISVRTVENHRHHILTKTQAKNVADLVRIAALAGLLSSHIRSLMNVRMQQP